MPHLLYDYPSYRSVKSVRDDVANFAIAMEDTLKLHDDRPGWKDESDKYLMDRMAEEAYELDVELREARFSDGNVQRNIERVQKELVDMANFCMMFHQNLERRKSQ